MKPRRVHWLGAAVGLALAASVLTACTVSISGGVAGIVGTLSLLGLLFGIGATQSGCSDDSVNACLSMRRDANLLDGKAEVSTCLTVGPDIGACLQPPMKDSGVEVGPCLDIAPDTGPDANVGPCLEPPMPDGSASLLRQDPGTDGEAVDPGEARSAAIAKLAKRLPADVVARLEAERSGRS